MLRDKNAISSAIKDWLWLVLVCYTEQRAQSFNRIPHRHLQCLLRFVCTMKLHTRFAFLLLLFNHSADCFCCHPNYTSLGLEAFERFAENLSHTRIHASSTNRTFDAVPARFGPPLPSILTGKMVSSWDDGDACHDVKSVQSQNQTAIHGSSEGENFYAGKIILVRGGNCSYAEKILRVQNARGIAVILAHNYVDLLPVVTDSGGIV